MPSLTIDSAVVPFEPGETLLQAARRAGIAIPTLCSYPGIEPPTSCYVCAVKIQGRRNVAPACATAAEEGLVVESGSEEVRRYRRRALELLMSEHAGDCEGPCRRICPADLDVPVLARHIAEGRWAAAARIVWERLALPGVLGHVCPAPCEKGCVRAQADGAVSIRELHRRVAEAAATSGEAAALRPAPPSGKRVAVVGAGPAGLSCAFYLARLGHACTVVDEREEPGGMLRYGIGREALPLPVLDREVAAIRALGVEFRTGCRIGGPQDLDDLAGRFDAVVVATGMPASGERCLFGVQATPKGIAVEAHTFATSRDGVFACGGAVAVCRLAARAVGQGRLAALSVDRRLAGRAAGAAGSTRCDSHLGKPDAEELRQLVSTDLASEAPAKSPDGQSGTGLLPVMEGRDAHATGVSGTPSAGAGIDLLDASLVAAAGRCLQCDCGKKLGCALRAYAQEYGANRDQYKTGARKRVARTRYASGLVHEPGKCIDCGRCVGITAAEKIEPGLAFSNRGFEVEVKAPFGAGLDAAMGGALRRCIDACPVGALWDGRRREQP